MNLIGYYSFSHCSSLTEITGLSPKVVVRTGAFVGCPSLGNKPTSTVTPVLTTPNASSSTSWHSSDNMASYITKIGAQTSSWGTSDFMESSKNSLSRKEESTETSKSVNRFAWGTSENKNYNENSSWKS